MFLISRSTLCLRLFVFLSYSSGCNVGCEPANFLDVGGNVKENQVLKAFDILLADKNVKAILVNVFGGIVNCETIARGIISAFVKIDLKIPLIVRLAGTNAEKAQEILNSSGLAIQSAANLDDAASLAVASIKNQ